MTFANLTLELGQRILTKAKIPFDYVMQVDLNYAGDRGYGPLTPGHSEYPVTVNYTRNGEYLLYKKVYPYMSKIIKELEDIADDAAMRD